MRTARQTVSHNIKALMNNSVPKVSQRLIGELINVKQPQVSLRLQGQQEWGLDELEAIAEWFGVEITLLVDSDPLAVHRWLAENGTIDLRDKPIPSSSCSAVTRSNDPRLFDPDGPEVVIDLRDNRVAEITQDGPLALYAISA